MGSVTHSTAADGTFSASGTTAWNATHTVTLAASDLSNGTTGTAGTAVVLATSGTLTTPIIDSFTFATLPSAASNSGAMARVTDIGPATAGSLWLSNGTIWKPVNGRVVIVPQVARTSAAGGVGETVTNLKFQFPAAFFVAGDKIQLRYSISKAGTTTIGAAAVRCGTNGTTADTQIYTSNVLSAANRSVGILLDLTIASATSMQVEGGSSFAVTGSYNVTASAYPTAVTISNVSNSLWLEVTVTPGATDAVALENGIMEYISA